MHHSDTPLLFLLLGFAVRALAGRKLGIWEDRAITWLIDKYIDPWVRRYIIRSERSLAIWLHHQLGHHGRNALLCEIGHCAKVTPIKKPL